jgi:hypothetical protein
MTKPPLHNMDFLFQQKLEELPVDVSQQQVQWQALSQAMHPQSTGFRVQLRKPWVKGLYMTIVALVPFGIFYFSNQPQAIESNASTYTPGSVANSLKLLNKIEPSTQTNEVRMNQQALTKQGSKPASQTVMPTAILNENKSAAVVNTQPSKHKDSVLATPTKQEKPVTKKTDSAYIYWQ